MSTTSSRELLVLAHADAQTSAMALPADAANTKRGSTQHFTVYYADSLGNNGVTLADAVLARCDQDYVSLQGFFGGIVAGPFNIYIQPGSNGAYHYSCDGTNLYCDAFSGTDGVLENMLVVSEESEVFMAVQRAGWDCGASNGEALSRVLAFELTGDTFFTAALWLESNRTDWVNENDPGAGTNSGYNPLSIGCSALFINYLRYQLGYSLNQIVQGGGSTLAETHINITNRTDGWTRFKTLVDRHFPPGDSLGLKTDNPFPFTIDQTQWVACATNQGGDLHVCALDENKKLWHTIRLADGRWPYPFGDVAANMPQGHGFGPTTRVACATNQSGDLHVCVLDQNNRLWHTIRLAEGGGSWPYPFGDVAANMPQGRGIGPISYIACATNQGGDLHVCALDRGTTAPPVPPVFPVPDKQLWHTIRLAEGGGSWPYPFENVAKHMPQGQGIGSISFIACATNQGGDLHVCALHNKQLWHTIRLAEGGGSWPYPFGVPRLG